MKSKSAEARDMSELETNILVALGRAYRKYKSAKTEPVFDLGVRPEEEAMVEAQKPTGFIPWTVLKEEAEVSRNNLNKAINALGEVHYISSNTEVRINPETKKAYGEEHYCLTPNGLKAFEALGLGDDVVDLQTFLSFTDLAQKHGVPREALRKRLETYRFSNDHGWVETTNRQPRESKYLYQESVVLPIICALQKRESAKTSGKRPPK